jgi:hypothetical protein
MVATARSKLLATFKQKKAAGLRDMKFFLGRVSESTVEDVCSEINRLYEEVDKGNRVSVMWGDSHRSSTAG